MNARMAAWLFDAGAPDWPRLLAAHPRLLAGQDLPDALIDHVLDGDDPARLAGLAANPVVLKRRPEIADRLAVALDPVAALRAVHTTREWEYRNWETLLRRCDPDDPAWTSADWRRVDLADMLGSVLVHSPVPAHHRALERFTYSRSIFTPREHAYSHAWNLRHDVRTRQPELDDADRVVAELDGTAAAVDEMRTGDPRHARERAELDWAAIAAAHAARPFASEVAAALSARGDCPDDVRVALFTTHPAEVAAWSRFPLTPLFSAPAAAVATAGSMLIQRLHSLGRFEELVAHGRPAREVLFTAHRSRADPGGASDPVLTPMHTAIGRLLAETVGTAPAAWKSLDRLLGGHEGTLPELCAKATATPDIGDGWPAARPGFDRGPFLALLDAAGLSAQIALIPHLDPPTLTGFATEGVWRREWFDHVVGHGTPPQVLALARARADLNTEQVRRLLDRDEPELTTLLLDRRQVPGRRRTVRRVEITDLREGASIGEVLAARPLDPHRDVLWMRAVVAHGHATWADVLRHCRPAHQMLLVVLEADAVDRDAALREVVGTAKPTAEALLLAVRMLADWTGTLPELLATAKAATAPDGRI